jgi:hypothetical protein
MPAEKMKKMNNVGGLSSEKGDSFFVLLIIGKKVKFKVPPFRHIYTRIAYIYKSFTFG